MHHCLSALLKKQEIHVQQAIHYIHEKGDGLSSHECTPMFSASLMHHVKTMITNEGHIDQHKQPVSVANTENDDVKPEWLKVSIDDHGILYTVTQVDVYLHHNQELKDTCFYDFVRCFKKLERLNTKNMVIISALLLLLLTVNVIHIC